MRFLKSMIPLLLIFCAGISRAQDTTFLPYDSTIATAQKDTLPVFHADKAVGLEVWSERTIPDSTLQHLRRDEAFWYANAEFKRRSIANRTGQESFWFWLFRQQWFFNLLWAIIIVSFVSVMILFLLKSNPRLFRKKAAPVFANDELQITENIFSINYDVEFKKAIAQNDYRTAVRLHYLQLLALLSGKELIQFQEGRTNSDYLMQLYSTPYYKSFKTLTRHFDYAWYGQFPITREAYQTIETDFVTFRSSMSL